MSYFRKKLNFNLLKNNSKLIFAHEFNISSPEKHVLHLNNYYEIYIYISGDADYIVGDSRYNLTRGDIVIINPYAAHKVVLKKECEYERFYILIPTNSFEQLKKDPLSVIHSSTLKGEKLINMSHDKQKALDILYKISDLSESDNTSVSVMCYGLLLEFLGLIGNTLEKNDIVPSNSQKTSIPGLVSEILIYIEMHFKEIQSVSEISDYFGISLPYLSTIFKKHMSNSLKSYIQAKKIGYAKELLDEDNNVTDACFECGFNDCSYFIKIFKQYTGMTPYKYKKNNISPYKPGQQ